MSSSRYVTAEYRVTQWNSFALITEFFILLLLASLIYRRCDFDTSPVARYSVLSNQAAS